MGERRNENEYVPTDFDFRIASLRGGFLRSLEKVQAEERERGDRVSALLRDKTFLDSCDAAMKALPKNAKVTKLDTRRQARRWLRHQGVAWAAFEAERERRQTEDFKRQMEIDNRPVAENLPHGIAGA